MYNRKVLLGIGCPTQQSIQTVIFPVCFCLTWEEFSSLIRRSPAFSSFWQKIILKRCAVQILKYLAYQMNGWFVFISTVFMNAAIPIAAVLAVRIILGRMA